MNETTFKLSLSIYLKEFEKINFKEIKNFIFEQSPIYKKELDSLKESSNEKRIQLKGQYIYRLKTLLNRIKTDKFEDTQFQQIYTQILEKIIEKENQ